MSRVLGRMLLPTEHVHHRDRNPSNNRLKNLILIPSPEEHWAVHRLIDRHRWRDLLIAEWHYLRLMYGAEATLKAGLRTVPNSVSTSRALIEALTWREHLKKLWWLADLVVDPEFGDLRQELRFEEDDGFMLVVDGSRTNRCPACFPDTIDPFIPHFGPAREPV